MQCRNREKMTQYLSGRFAYSVKRGHVSLYSLTIISMPGLLLRAAPEQLSKANSEWTFSFRGGFDSGSEDESEDGGKIMDEKGQQRKISEDARLLEELDIASRAEADTARFRANPWSIAKVNAYSRAVNSMEAGSAGNDGDLPGDPKLRNSNKNADSGIGLDERARSPPVFARCAKGTQENTGSHGDSKKKRQTASTTHLPSSAASEESGRQQETGVIASAFKPRGVSSHIIASSSAWKGKPMIHRSTDDPMHMADPAELTRTTSNNTLNSVKGASLNFDSSYDNVPESSDIARDKNDLSHPNTVDHTSPVIGPGTKIIESPYVVQTNIASRISTDGVRGMVVPLASQLIK